MSSSTKLAALDVIGVHKAFGSNIVLDGLNLSVAPATITAVLGPSGGGKTTLLRLIAGFERATGGTIALHGHIVEGPGVSVAPERRHIGIVPQEGALFPHLSVEGNIGFGLRHSSDRATRIAECLALVGLEGYERARPHEISGGQQQRVALARALAPRPSLIVLDEPFSSLDAGLRTQVRDDVCTLLRAAHATVVLVTHDQQEALSVADQVAVLLRGRIVQAADPLTVYREPVNLDVATFVGDALVIKAERHNQTVNSPLGRLDLRNAAGLPDSVLVVIRPEQVRIVDSPGSVDARVTAVTFHGHDGLVTLAIKGLANAVTARLRVDELPVPGTEVRVRVIGSVSAYPNPVHREQPADVPNSVRAS